MSRYSTVLPSLRRWCYVRAVMSKKLRADAYQRIVDELQHINRAGGLRLTAVVNGVPYPVRAQFTGVPKGVKFNIVPHRRGDS